ncbi:MAG: extracellular solute-binding protein [Alphaproteobacteria bacterium]|nr:extracellular solute-binding protein [Alphaproteobacteria bacterium]
MRVQTSEISRRAALLAIGLGVLFSASTGSAQAPQAAEQAWPYLLGLKPEERATTTVREAKREATLVIYGALGIDRAKMFLEPFQAKYPGIKVDFVRLTVNDLYQKISLENRTNRVNADAVITSTPWLDLVDQFFAPYEPVEWDSFDSRFRYGGVKQGWAALDYELLLEAIAWRTDRVKPEEAPKTLEDLTDPRWKGRIGTVTSQERVIDGLIQERGEDKAMALVTKVAAQQNRMYPSIAALSQALASGEVEVAYGIGAYRAHQLKTQGAPIDWVFPKPLFSVGDMVAAMRKAPHPYAAALFIDFLTSAQTLEMLDKLEPGRAFANKKGSYEIKLDKLESLIPFRPIPEARYKELNRTVERLFIRR